MISFRRQVLLKSFKLFDLAGMTFAFLLGAAVESYEMGPVSLADFLSMRIKVQNFVIFLGFLFVWHAIFSFFRLYQSRRLSTQREEIIDVLKATSFGTLVIAAAGLLLRIIMITPTFLAVFWVSSSSLAILGRHLMRYALRQFRLHGRNLRNILIAGTNPSAIHFARKIEGKPELGYRIIGFADNIWAKIQEFQKTGYALVTSPEEFPAFLRKNVVDEVAICLPLKSYYYQAAQMVACCEEQGIIVRFPSPLFNLKLAQSRISHLEGEAVITHYTGNMEGWPVIMKRVLDFTLSLILLIILSPFFLITSLLIKITSPGPVFFIQERVGLNKHRFRLFKFRTMVQGAEKMITELEHLNEVSGPVFKIKNDPRITKIGNFVRKTSIDELPQLISVLKGDMSLVGPRPLPVRDFEGFDEDWHRRRFSVRPGITCLWQINGRSNTGFEEWMKFDMQYIDEWSLFLDFKILLKTIPAVLRGSGAA